MTNERGESLVTVLISAVLLLAVASMAAPSILNSLKQQQANNGSPSVCRSVAHNIINKIRADGVQGHFYPTRVDSVGTQLNSSSWHQGNTNYNNDGVTPELTINSQLFSERWPNLPAVDFATGNPPFRSHTPRLIHSSINGLLAIYNRVSNVCDPGALITNSNELSNLFPGNLVGNQDVQATLVIRPYDWSTRQILPCTRPLRIRPYARHEPPMAQQLGIADFSMYRADRGLEVEVQVTTRPANDQTAGEKTVSCAVKEKFEFDRQPREPKMPVLTASGGTFTFRNVMDAGTHMVCRSTHNFITNPLGRAMGTATGVGNRTPWMPCDRLTLCGDSGNTTVMRSTATITKSFSVPSNCAASVEVKTFDAFGNVSDTQPATTYGNSTNVTTSFDESSDSGGVGYEVGGTQFSTAAAAAQASAISGLPVQTIAEVTVGMDSLMNSVAGNVSSAGASASAAAGHNAAAQSSLSAAQGAAASAQGTTTSASSARSSATAARSAANAAQASATSARAEATAARAAADAVASTAGPLGDAISSPAQAAAEAAAAEAEAAAEAAEEAARLAAEAAAAAEQAAQDKEDAEDNDDD